MSFKIYIPEIEKEFRAHAKETILSASLRNLVPYPYSCQNGRCGQCKSRLISGEVEHLPHNKFTLNEKEKSEGLILACKAVPKTDVTVNWLFNQPTLLPITTKQTRVLVKERLTHDTWRLVLIAQDSNVFNFLPGQYALLRFQNSISRNYSMANQPKSNKLEFFIREAPNGAATTFISQSLKVGDLVEAQGPFGEMYLRKEHTGPILLVGGGSGIAPIKSILDHALTNNMRQSIYLYFGVRETKDVYLENYFKILRSTYSNLHIQIVVDKGSPDFSYRAGRVGDAVLNDISDFSQSWNAYMAGPPPMITDLTRRLIQCGISEQSIWSDPFL